MKEREKLCNYNLIKQNKYFKNRLVNAVILPDTYSYHTQLHTNTHLSFKNYKEINLY